MARLMVDLLLPNSFAACERDSSGMVAHCVIWGSWWNRFFMNGEGGTGKIRVAPGQAPVAPGPAAGGARVDGHGGVVLADHGQVVGAAQRIEALPDQLHRGRVLLLLPARAHQPEATDRLQPATHLGGVLEWNDAESSWDCPLHGSRFAPDGTLLEGPAVNDLAKLD